MSYPHRSFLVVSAASGDFESLVESQSADALVFDLAVLDSNQSSQMLPTIAKAVRSQLESPTPVLVRVTAPCNRSTREQLSAVIQNGLAGVILAGAREPQDVRDVDVLLREFELDRDIDPGAIGLILTIDSPRSLIDVRDILLASDRLTGVVFDTDAYVASSRLVPTRKGRELDYPRSYISLMASAHGLLAFDYVSSGSSDSKQLTRDCERVRSFGFAGRFVALAEQLKAVNRAFEQ
jgi:citrate lyase subunit beta / citryl-CoA lyase